MKSRPSKPLGLYLVLEEISRFCLSIYLTNILIRVLELSLISSSQFVERHAIIFLKSISNDALIVCVMALIYWLVYKSSFLKRMLKLAAYIYLLISFIAALYFEITLQLLDRTVLQFSIKELINIIKTFGEFKWYYLFLFFLVPLPPLLNHFQKKINIKSSFFLPLLAFLATLSFLINESSKDSLEVKIAANKASFFIMDLNAFLLEATPNEEYFSTQHPLMRQVSKANPLGGFFSSSKKQPNLVFIIVESLSSSFSGPLSREISFTPFLDSLASNSIYFPNFISTSERTFGVLPSALASLPHGKSGFSKLQINMPSHSSILKVLNNHDYHTSFYYGGDANYDNMSTFLQRNEIDTIYDFPQYNYDKTEYVLSIDDVDFGVDDQQLFENASNSWRMQSSPFTHIYLTLSMHYPFRFKGQDTYLDLARKRIEEEAKANILEKKKYLSNLKVFSSCMFTDDALKYLFKAYVENGLYDNTIFFIFGDHALGPVPKANDLEKYRTPLFIHSKLLEKPKVIKAINSHLDLAPSVINLLRDNFDLPIEERAHWLGSPFDTSSSFTSTREVVLMRNNRTSNDFLFNEHVILNDELYHIDSNFHLSMKKDQQLLTRIESYRDSIKAIQHFAVEKNRVMKTNDLYLTTKKKQYNGMEFSQNREYVGLVEYTLPKDEDAIALSVDFELMLSENASLSKEPPLLVVRIKNSEGETNYWEKTYFKSENGIHQYKASFSKLFEANKEFPLSKGDNLKLFLWSVHQSESTIMIKEGTIKIESKL